jgi:hypothetical protein
MRTTDVYPDAQERKLWPTTDSMPSSSGLVALD